MVVIAVPTFLLHGSASTSQEALQRAKERETIYQAGHRRNFSQEVLSNPLHKG